MCYNVSQVFLMAIDMKSLYLLQKFLAFYSDISFANACELVCRMVSSFAIYCLLLQFLMHTCLLLIVLQKEILKLLCGLVLKESNLVAHISAFRVSESCMTCGTTFLCIMLSLTWPVLMWNLALVIMN